jgi:hypothetical protein
MKQLYPGYGYAMPIASGKTTVLSAAILFTSFSSHTQTLVPELVFSNPQLQTIPGSKPAGENGAVYIFRNVTQGIDAQITINGRSDKQVSLSSMDMPGPEQDGANGTGYDNAWQPRVAYHNGQAPANRSWWMEFRIRFVQHAENAFASSVSQFMVTAMDLDGDAANLHEILTFYGLQHYRLEKNSAIQAAPIAGTLSDPSQAGIEFDGPVKNYPKISTTATDVMVTSTYTNGNSFVIRVGAKTGNSSSTLADRMNSLWFKSFDYNDSVNSPLPVSLVGSTAQLDDRKFILDWAAALEIDGSHFTLQRRTDRASFDDEAFVFAYNFYNRNGILVNQETRVNAGQKIVMQHADLPAGMYVTKTTNGNLATTGKL